MNDEPFIPKKTADKIAEHHPEGTRHAAALAIAIPLIGNGLDPNAVFVQLRSKFPADVGDKELHDIVAYAVSIRPTPSGYGQRVGPYQSYRPQVAHPIPPPKRKTPQEQAEWWLSGAQMTMEDFCEQSHIMTTDADARKETLTAFLELLYQGADNINVVCKYGEEKGKARPEGPGRILSRDKWLEYLNSDGIPESKAGAWFRPNPVQPQGSGASGAVTDSDVVDFRFLLLESDSIPLPVQFALFSKLKIPISAAYLSGGVSVHTLVRIDAETAKDFEEKARRITSALVPFGIDACNKNPSRLSRLPSARRVIGASGDGIQRLLWLNPQRVAITEQEIAELEDSLLLPAIEEKPFRRVITEAIERYEELIQNRGHLGVPTGFQKFDRMSGGLKPGGYTLVCAETGVGKTTFALNLVNSALKSGVGVVWFTLEMSRPDIADMMFSLNCDVNRNNFNTGEFTESDLHRMVAGATTMQNLPLWLDDDPDLDTDTLRRRTLALKADGRIGLAVVDYAQLVRPDFRSDNREQEVASVALALRLLSRQANIPIVVLSQLNDAGKARESRKLAHEAANMFTLVRENLSDPKITMFINKGRKIPSHPMALVLKAEYCRITEAAPISQDDVPVPYPND